jgi:hypothetical protein
MAVSNLPNQIPPARRNPLFKLNRLAGVFSDNLPWQAGVILLALLLGVGAGLLAVLLPNPLIGFVGVMGLVVAGVMFARPLFTLGEAASICCLLPFGTIPVKLGLTFTFLEAALLVLFVIWLLRLVVSNRLQAAEGLVSSPFDWAILLFIGLSVFCYILNWQTASSTDLIHSYAKLLLAILQFFAVINIVRTQVALDTLVTVLMLAGSAAGYLGAVLTRLPRDLQFSLLAKLSIVGYPTDDRVLRYVEDDPLKPQRATGTSIDPNSFGGLLVLVVALLVTQLVSVKPLLPRWLLSLMLLGPLFSLYLTYSRGSQLGAIAVIGFVALLKYRKIFLYALPFLLAGAVWLPSTFLGARLAAGFALEDQATVLRLAEYRNALDVIGNHPWFGVGFGSIATLNLTVPVSMIYLTIAERMGLIGLVLFLLLMFLFLSYSLNRLGKLKVDRQQANLLGLTGGVVGALAVGLLDHYFFNGEFSHMATLLWLFMGLAVVQVKIGEADLATELSSKNSLRK